MNEVLFGLSIAFIAIVFISRHKIVDYFSYNLNIRIESEVIVYFLTILLICVVLAGMLLDNTKEKYSQISQDYENLKPKEDKRPHRYFDVNTYD